MPDVIKLPRNTSEPKNCSLVVLGFLRELDSCEVNKKLGWVEIKMLTKRGYSPLLAQ